MTKENLKYEKVIVRKSIGEKSARVLSVTKNTPPQIAFKTPRWFLRLLPKVDVPSGIYRVNRVKVYATLDEKINYQLGMLTFPPEELKKISLFKFLTLSELEKISKHLKLVQYRPGEVVVTENEEGNSFYIIVEGLCEVTAKSKFGNEQIIAMLTTGDFFGETVIIPNSRRNATVTAKTSLHVLCIKREYFADILKNESTKIQIERMFEERKLLREETLKSGEKKIDLSTNTTNDLHLKETFVEYEENPLEYDLNSIQTVLRLDTKIKDIYDVPYDQLESQLQIIINAIEEREEFEVLNSPEFGLLNIQENKARIIPTKKGPPTPDDFDELISLVWKKPTAFFCHPKALAAFGRECTLRGVPPVTVQMFGTQFITWRGIPIFPCEKFELVNHDNILYTKVLLVRFGEMDQGVVGLYKKKIGSENIPSLDVKFMGIDNESMAKYLLTKYFGIAQLVPDAVGILDNVEVGRFYE